MEPSSFDARPCRVIGADKLPAELGGAKVLCAAIEQAVATAAPVARYAVEVQVQSSSSLAATLRTAKGQTLPVQKMAVSDAALTKASIERFARAIGAQLAKVGDP